MKRKYIRLAIVCLMFGVMQMTGCDTDTPKETENVYEPFEMETESQSEEIQNVAITVETKFSELQENIIYTLNGNEYVKSDFENAGTLWYLQETGEMPHITYAEWCEHISSMMYPFEEWLKLSTSQRAGSLSEHVYTTVKNHINWSSTEEDLGNLTEDQKLWLYMIYNYALDEDTYELTNAYYDELGLSTIAEARMYEATSLVYMQEMYNTIMTLDTVTTEEVEWNNRVLELEKSESNSSSSSKKPSSQSGGTSTSQQSTGGDSNSSVSYTPDSANTSSDNFFDGEDTSSGPRPGYENVDTIPDHGFASGLHQ